MRKAINEQAWAILSEDERLVLNMQFVEGKSTWQAGEILGKSHYKYLEISYRAKHFMRMFTEHITLFDQVFPVGLTGSREIIKYFRYCILERMKVHEAFDKLDAEFGFQKRKGREQFIIEQMEKWGCEEGTNHINFTVYSLIKEFDRWNNFRILPRAIQEPSAFNRRVKNIYRRHLKIVSKFPDLSIMRIKEVHGISTKKAKTLYLPVIGEKGGAKILALRDSLHTLRTLNSISMYAFKREEDAKVYLKAIETYLKANDRKCQDGLTFWPVYRKYIKIAMNYKEVQQISPNRSYLIQALSKLELY